MDESSEKPAAGNDEDSVVDVIHPPELTSRWSVFVFLTSLVLGGVLVILLSQRSSSNFDDAAVAGADTSRYFATVNGVSVHCQDAHDMDKCLDGLDVPGHDDNLQPMLWLGNSQLHALNQYAPGEVNAPELLHVHLADLDRYLLTFSQPNANLQEHLVLFAYLSARLPLKSLLLSMVYDDTRESGLRPDVSRLLEDVDTRHLLAASAIGQRLLVRNGYAIDGVSGAHSSNDVKPAESTTHLTWQQRSETWLDAHLSDLSGVWADRADMRATLFFSMYSLRNRVFGISATTKRRRIPASYADNIAAYRALLHLAKAKGVTARVYNAPLRQDIEIPYLSAEYAAFKQEVTFIAKDSGAHYRNLETLIEPVYWGYTGISGLSGNTRKQVDFMHFRASGHQILADALADWVVAP